MSSSRPSVLAFCALLGTWGPAEAQDLDALGKLLTPAYTSMSYAGLCSMEKGWSSSQPRGAHGIAIQYAEHIKNEVIASLGEEEAVAVLKKAADMARNNSRAELRAKVITANKVEEASKFREWCQNYVQEFIAELI